jgi:1-acyl-sn-glycerol-3-phosphate acyltransferase
MNAECQNSVRYTEQTREYRSAVLLHYCFAFFLVVSHEYSLAAPEDSVPIVLGFVLAIAWELFIWWASTQYRRQGMLPLYSTLFCIGVAILGLSGRPVFSCLLLTTLGLTGMIGSMATIYFRWVNIQEETPPRTGGRRRYRFEKLVLLAPCICIALICINHVLLDWFGGVFSADSNLQAFKIRSLLALSGIFCLACWVLMFRPFFELCCEAFFWFLYDVRGAGPGLNTLPNSGPLLIIANHACWFDPLFLAKILHRPITPMMTESFYKIWFLRPLLKHVFHVIVVRETSARRDVPELQEAIAALNRGESVVLFPEGFLQRKADIPIRRFARGVWHILAARPETLVVSCWIEGGWQSKFSWWLGPPGKNKRMDFRRPIRIGVSAPGRIPAEVLADQFETRLQLMNQVNFARMYVGLERLPAFERVSRDDSGHVAQADQST